MLTRVGAWARIAQGLTKQCWDDTNGTVGNSAALVRSAVSTKSAAGADDNLDSGRSKACEAVTLAACVLAVGSWLVRTCQCSCGSFGSNYQQFAAVSYMGKKLAEHGIMGAPAV
jgi:hypothetical protein